MNVPEIRLAGSPNAARWGATDTYGTPIGDRPSETALMKAAALMGRVPKPRSSSRPTSRQIAELRRAADHADDPITKSEAGEALTLALMKAAIDDDTLLPGVHAHSPLDKRERFDDEAHRIPRFDPREYAPSVDGIKARGVQKTTPGAGGETYGDANANLTEIAKAADPDVLLKLARSMNRTADAIDARTVARLRATTPIVKSDGSVEMPRRRPGVTVPLRIAIG